MTGEMDPNEKLLDIIRQAKAKGIHMDEFKSSLIDQMAPRSKYRLRGHAGAVKLGSDLGRVFKVIDDNWDSVEIERDGK